VLLLALLPFGLAAQTALDEESPWPRVRSDGSNSVTLHLPQVERWMSNWFVARAVVEVKPDKAKKSDMGVVWFEAHGRVNHSNRIVTLDQLEITKGRFPEAIDGGSNDLAIVRRVIPAGARTVSLDYLITALGFEQAASRQGPKGLKHEPPEIIWVTNRTVLILVDGEPVFRPITNTTLERVINTPELLVRDKAARLYLASDTRWFAADSLDGPWSLIQSPPAELASLKQPNAPAAPPAEGPAPRIIVRTHPAEMFITAGVPDFRPIKGTVLHYAADTDSLLFLHGNTREFFLLISGRWFKSMTLKGPWNYVAPRDLPEDFAKIPPNSPQAVVLASVPDTPQAELALVANSAPTTATVNRHTATIQLTYDGEPQFKPIEGTTMSYAVNAQLPVIRLEDKYYAVDNAVWFVAKSPTGPWEVAAEVPEEIYTIPPESPVYYATYVRVYDADENSVEVGYTPGYTGSYEDDGTMVYGTGWNYQPWTGSYYYGWGWSWGYSYWYVPWYQWWVWRPWWGESGGLRAAVIDNIYDRWQNGNVVTPHGGGRSSATWQPPDPDYWQRAQRPPRELWQRPTYAGYPSLYGRFQAPTKPIPFTPPQNTLAFNPYTRPKSAAHSGDIPRGAELLTTVRQSSGGGRDLFASPDGNVYMRRNDGWYRRQSGGNWAYFAPAQGAVERNQVGSARGSGAAAGANAYRIAPGANAAGARGQGRDRVPDIGSRAQASEVAALDRQYYARALSEMRTRNVRPNYNAGGGRVRAGRRR
jgi:hypothetical protein